MKYKKYSSEIWTQIKNTTNALKHQGHKMVAAFDADGTLWDTDLGENLFHYTIDQRLVPLPESPWNYYLEMKKINSDPRSAYLWLAKIYQGLPLSQVQKWAEEAIQSISPIPIFNEQKDLISYLISEGVTVNIVTASVKWAIEPAAHLFGLSPAHVIGVETKVNDLIISDEQSGVITYKKGKPDALKNKFGFYPYLSAGNTEGDLELLEAATHLRLAVSAANRDDYLYKTEYRLQEIVQQRGWMGHRFI